MEQNLLEYKSNVITQAMNRRRNIYNILVNKYTNFSLIDNEIVYHLNKIDKDNLVDYSNKRNTKLMILLEELLNVFDNNYYAFISNVNKCSGQNELDKLICLDKYFNDALYRCLSLDEIADKIFFNLIFDYHNIEL